MTRDITPKQPVIRHHPAFSLCKCTSTVSRSSNMYFHPFQNYWASANICNANITAWSFPLLVSTYAKATIPKFQCVLYPDRNSLLTATRTLTTVKCYDFQHRKIGGGSPKNPMRNPSHRSLANCWLFADDCMLCHVLALHAQQMALMFIKSIAWGEREKITATITRTWQHFSPIWALFWYRGYSRGSACPLCTGTNGSLWFPGWHQLLPFAVALRHKCIVSAWLQFLRIPALWALGAAASLSPASENHLYY